MEGLDKYPLNTDKTTTDKYGPRMDGTSKGLGWFGELPMTDGSDNVMTEVSMTFDYGNGDVQVPLLNPYLDKEEIAYLLAGGEPDEGIMQKSYQFGADRISQGKSPFIQQEDVEGLKNYNFMKDVKLQW